MGIPFRTFLTAAGMGLIAYGHGQNYNWGWGIPLTATMNGSTLQCSAFDPEWNNTYTTSVYNVATYQNEQGVIAYRTASDAVGGVVYDLNDHSWRTTTFSYNADADFDLDQGVIAYVSGSGTLGAATYDPAQAQWEYTVFSYSSGNSFVLDDGVVAYVSDGSLGGATYDPRLHQWKYTVFSYASDNVVQNHDGVIGWVGSSGSAGGAVYDIENEQWDYEIFSYNADEVVVGSGVVAYKGSSSLGGAAYDREQHDWKTETFSYSSNNTALSIESGTVHWLQSGDPKKYGFLTSEHDWQDEEETELVCTYYTDIIEDGQDIHLTYLWCMSIGASSYSHACGDGHLITRRWAWKQYAAGGTNYPELTVLSSMANHTCNGVVSFTTTGITEIEAGPSLEVVSAYDNSVVLRSTDPWIELELIDPLGRRIFSTTAYRPEGITMELAPGQLFLARARYKDGPTRVRKVVLD